MPDKDIYEDFQRRTAEFLQHMQTDKSFHPYHRSKTARETARWNALYHGEMAPTNDGFFGELSDRFQGAYIGSLHGLGATLNEFGLGSGMQDYFSGVLRRNQQWNAPDENSIGGYIGGALGGAVGSTLGTLTASTAGKIIGTAMGGPKVGYAVGMTAGITVGFMQTFGENVQRNREAGYGENKALGMAFLESGVDSVIENMPWGIVGKGGKLAVNAGRISRITAAGKKELLKKVGQKMAAQVGQKEAQNLLWKWAKQATVSGLGESGEEGLQYLNSYVNQKLGGDPNAKFSMDELADAMAQGFIGGFGMGGATSLPGIRHEAKMRKLNTATAQPEAENTPIPEVAGAEIEQPAGEVSEAVNNDQPLFDTLIADVGNALGINIDFMDSRPDGAELEEKSNGIYDKNNKTLYLNRNTYSVNPAETLGHELKHYIDDNDPELSKAFNSLLEAGKTEAGKRGVSEIAREFGITEAEGNVEFSADMFGKLFARPETWKKMAAQLDERTPGMGEKFLQTLRDFYALVKTKLADLVGINPEAETFLNNVTDLENEAARMLAELRRRNRNSTQVENVVGAKGNTNVETVPVSQINVDAKRFQFKSNTSKTSGVDESNKLGGDWDPRTAGNLYLWEDKNGNLYVVNGHHRLELAQRNGVENINAIIDREADGVTAEQARRNGVLINIRDGQGEVRDYASFVRSEKLSEDEAKSQGVTARQKGRAGFLLGKAGDTLYEAYVNEVIPESKAVIIAEVAQGNEAIEYAGIKLATDRKLAGETLRQTLKLAAQNTSGKKADTEQGGLFDMVDDSVLQEWEAIGKIAAKHIKEIRTRIEAAKDAIKNPEAAKSLGVKTTKGAEKLLAQAQEELARWENYATDSELMAQLREEAGIAPQEVVSETEKTTAPEEVASAENAQTTPAKSVEEKQIETAEPIPPSAEKSSGDSNNALQKMRNAFDNRVEIRNSTSKQMPWTDIAREYADGKVLSKEADDLIINEIADMSMEDYQNSEVNNILHAIANNPIHSVRARSRAKSALKSIEKKRLVFAGAITLDSTKTVAEMIAEDENLWEQEKKRYPDTDPSKSVFKQRLDYLKSLSEKEIVEHDVLVKEKKGETAATTEESSEVEETPEEIERKRIQKIYADIPNRKNEIGYTFEEFKQAFEKRKNKIVNAAERHYASHADTWYGTQLVDRYEIAANDAMVKAYKKYSRKKGELENYVSRAIKNAIVSVNREAKTDRDAKGGNISLDQTNEQGEALSEAVADENETKESDSISSRENPQEAKRRITESKKLSPVQKKIVDLLNQGLSPSVVMRKLGMRFGEEGHEYMSKEEFQHQIVAIRTIAEEEGVLYSRKRGTDEKPIVNIMPDTPEGIELKSIPDVREYLRSIFEGKKFKIKSDGRPTAIDFAGIRSAVKKRGINRQALFDAQNIVINSYLVGYEYADLRHLNKHQNINGQFIYVSLIDINSKPFAAVIKLDDFANDQYAIFKDIAVKKITPAVRGTTGNGTIANPPDQVSDVTIHQLVDFVKQHFKENKNFTENVADVFEKRLDNAYFAALEKGDIKRAELMVKNAAKRSVYHEDSDYQGSLAFNGSAPAKNEYYESKEDRADAWNNGNYEGEFSLGDFADNGIDTHDLEWQLTNPTAYRIADSFGKESIRNLQSAVKNPRKTIKIYRAVDANIKENSIRNGDWVTPSKSYATQHIELQDWEHGRIIEQEVSIDDIWWNGDDINEWGYDDGKNYAYANTPNNRKLLDTVTYDDNGNIIPLSQRFNRRKEDVRYSRKRLHQQINPIVRDGKVRDEYADLLANKEYTPTTLKELQDKAFEWILERGGIVKAAQDFLANKAPADSAVAEIARRYILNSDVFADNMSFDDRVKLNTLEINERSKAGLTLRSMRLDSLNLKDVASVQALLNKLHKDMPSKDLQKLRNDIMKNLGIDIFKLPKDIVDDKSKLDAVLRAHLAHKAKWHDKIYEYWINGILSGPSTHASNLLGNTANAVYELGIKRFTEALVNIAAGRKDGATFGEFKAMIKAFNWANAKAAAKEAFDLEVIDPSGKFLENSNTAIGGKTGRAIRTPGRLLKAADALAKAIIQPMETAAYAYRMGVQEGLTGTKLQEYIQKQLTDKDSKAYQWAKERAKELTFQEDPGSAVKYLMAMKESDGAMGIILKMFLPFLKTPANILRQGVRKGPLGIVNLAWETGKLALGKRDFDGQYVSRVAEQLLAWGVVMALAGLSDDDELPVITGTSAPYGSAEYGFKGNKVPPYSIRIGNTWYSYQRIEPFATGLAAIADGIQAFRDVRNGKDGTAVMKELIGSGIKTIGEKSYLDSIGEIIKMVQDPERNAMRPVTNLLASSVPALWRQPRQAFTEEVGDSKSRSRGLDWWREQFFTVTNRAGITTAIPKIDYFGREVKKDDWGDTPLSPAGRILPVKRVEADSNMDQAERLIWNYNQKNPNSEYYPSIPGNTFTVDKQKLYLDGENYTNFAKDAGKLAHRQINNAIKAGYLNVNNPSEKDIELIKKIFTRARKETRAKYISKAKKQ